MLAVGSVDAEHKWMHGEKYGDERNVLSPGKKNRISRQKKGWSHDGGRCVEKGVK